MNELTTGDYLLTDNNLIRLSEDHKLDKEIKCIRLVSKDFNKIDLMDFNGCLIDVLNTPLNLEIKIWQLESD